MNAATDNTAAEKEMQLIAMKIRLQNLISTAERNLDDSQNYIAHDFDWMVRAIQGLDNETADAKFLEAQKALESVRAASRNFQNHVHDIIHIVTEARNRAAADADKGLTCRTAAARKYRLTLSST